MPRQMSIGEYIDDIGCKGPVCEFTPSALLAGIPTSMLANATYTSPLFSADGFYAFIMSITFSGASGGAIALVQYIDDAGTVLNGVQLLNGVFNSGTTGTKVTSSAAGPLILDVNFIGTQVTPFASYQLVITNGASASNLTAVAALFHSDGE